MTYPTNMFDRLLRDKGVDAVIAHARDNNIPGLPFCLPLPVIAHARDNNSANFRQKLGQWACGAGQRQVLSYLLPKLTRREKQKMFEACCARGFGVGFDFLYPHVDPLANGATSLWSAAQTQQWAMVETIVHHPRMTWAVFDAHAQRFGAAFERVQSWSFC